MSEYQYVGFRAIAAPVKKKDLAFMREQSSRAEVTAWSFDNEYHYGDFRGDAAEMLRRGYDVHLHYANFGIRKLMIRLPHGLPDAKAAEPYFEGEALVLMKDKRGPGGILCVEPFYEAGELEELWGLDEMLERLLPLRDEIVDGDLRPLYLAWLAVACDNEHDPDEVKEAPVPAGLAHLSEAQRALLEFYDISASLVAAAAQKSPPLPKRTDSENPYLAWLQRQPDAVKTAWLAQWMADAHSTVRSEMLAQFKKSQDAPAWPTVRVDRTIADLQTAAEHIQRGRERKAAEAAARQRAKRLAGMTANPEAIIAKTEELAKRRSTDAYREIATLLAELREALAESDQSGLADQQARKLHKKHPTRTHLTGALRHQGFLKK